jgi:hypothetical protein
MIQIVDYTGCRLGSGEIIARIQNIFGSDKKVLSANTLRNRLNNRLRGGPPSMILSSKRISQVLSTSDKFKRAHPRDVGSNKWFDEKYFTKNNVKISEKVRRKIDIWKLS